MSTMNYSLRCKAMTGCIISIVLVKEFFNLHA